MSVILEHVSKAYGRQKALDDIGFRLEEGEICGFLGPNGAGKSTTMKIITGCLNDYQGEVRIKEMNLRENPLKIKAIIGYLPEQNPLYPDLYIREYLLHVARLYRVGRPVAKVNAIIERTGLEPEIQKKIGQLSKGYRQRVGLAQALVHDPEILILDEPMTGLDPNQLEEIRHLIKETGKKKTVLLSTHIMQEVEAICDRVIIINQGKIVADRPIGEICTHADEGMVLRVEFSPGSDTHWLSKSELFTHTSQQAPNCWRLTSPQGKDPRGALFSRLPFAAVRLSHCIQKFISWKIFSTDIHRIFRQSREKINVAGDDRSAPCRSAHLRYRLTKLHSGSRLPTTIQGLPT